MNRKIIYRNSKATDSEIIENIISFLKPDSFDPTTLKIELDKLCGYLINKLDRTFSVTQFEKALLKEIDSKLMGKPIDNKLLTALAKYINDLSIYLENEMKKTKQGRLDKILEKAKKNARK